MQVTVIYALPNIQYFYKVNLKSGSTVKDAILASNVLNLIKNISFYNNRIGIYNKLVHFNVKIKDGDRIEIYRKLIVDPKERRRKKIFFLKKK